MTITSPLDWLRTVIEGDKAEAAALAALPSVSSSWHETCSGVLETAPPDAEDPWDGTWTSGDSRLTRFIAKYDPEDRIADCEAKLALLDLHHPVMENYTDGDGQSRTSYQCDECDTGGSPDNWPCQTVRTLASACRHREGWAEHWGAQ